MIKELKTFGDNTVENMYNSRKFRNDTQPLTSLILTLRCNLMSMERIYFKLQNSFLLCEI
jgi:hypothetical protein